MELIDLHGFQLLFPISNVKRRWLLSTHDFRLKSVILYVHADVTTGMYNVSFQFINILLCHCIDIFVLTMTGLGVDDLLAFFFVVCGVPGNLSACALEIMLTG